MLQYAYGARFFTPCAVLMLTFVQCRVYKVAGEFLMIWDILLTLDDEVGPSYLLLTDYDLVNRSDMFGVPLGQ